MDTADSGFRNETIGIVGLGLIGGSYAKGFRRIGISHIIGIDNNEQTLQQALAAQAVDEAYISGNEALRKATILVFCLPVRQMIDFIKKNAIFFHPHVVITDVAGIKGDTAQQVNRLLTEEMDFIPGHPMAGREGQGFRQSDASIFQQANYILVPQESNRPGHIDKIKQLALALGCAHVVTVTPEEHDRLIAYTSSLPHVLATALVNSRSMDDNTKYFIAGSFRDGTRVADINAPLWTQLFFENKDNLIHEINKFQASLTEFTELINSGDSEKMIQYLEKAASRRKELIHGNHIR